MPRRPRSKNPTKPFRKHYGAGTRRAAHVAHDQTVRRKRKTQTKHTQVSGPFTPAVRHNHRGRVISQNPRPMIERRTVERWFSGYNDPPLGHRTLKAARAQIPKQLRGIVRPRMCRFQVARYERFNTFIPRLVDNPSSFEVSTEGWTSS